MSSLGGQKKVSVQAFNVLIIYLKENYSFLRRKQIVLNISAVKNHCLPFLAMISLLVNLLLNSRQLKLIGE